MKVSTDGDHAVVNGVGGWALVELRPLRVVTIVRDEPMEVLEVPDSIALSPDGSVAAVGRLRDVILVSSASGGELRPTIPPAGDSMLTGAWIDDDTPAVGGWKGTLNVPAASDLPPLVPQRRVAPGWISDFAGQRGRTAGAGADTDGQLPGGRSLLDISDAGGQVEVTTNPADWIRQACRLAARESPKDEWSGVHPDHPRRPTCGRNGAAAVEASSLKVRRPRL